MEESQETYNSIWNVAKKKRDINYQFNVPWNVESINFTKKESGDKLYEQRKKFIVK